MFQITSKTNGLTALCESSSHIQSPASNDGKIPAVVVNFDVDYYNKLWNVADAVITQIPDPTPDDIAKEVAAQKASQQSAIDRANATILSLKTYDNQYVLLARSLGLPDKASTDDIQKFILKLKGDGTNLQDSFQAVTIALQFLSLINAIGQNGGSWDEIVYHPEIV